MRPVLIAGSTNLDSVFNVRRLPRPGETVNAKGLEIYFGGKGANQAIAAIRSGAPEVHFASYLGADPAGDRFRTYFAENRLDIRFVQQLKDETTGAAVIAVDEHGENFIITTPGANGKLTAAAIEEALKAIRAGVFLVQLETPSDEVEIAIEIAKKLGWEVVLNAAPAVQLLPATLKKLPWLIVNQVEAEFYSGSKIDEPYQAFMAAEQIRQLGVENVIITLGADGALVHNRSISHQFPALEAKVVDTTGAGDCFCGSFAAALARGKELDYCMQFALAAASIAVTKHGAQPAMPNMEQILQKMLSEV